MLSGQKLETASLHRAQHVEMAMVEREDLFDLAVHMRGFEPKMSRKIYRYRPTTVVAAPSVALQSRP